MKPGATIIPPASKTSASCNAANFPGALISFTSSPSRRTSIAASVFDAGSINWPFFISSILRVLALRHGLVSSAIRRAPIVSHRSLRGRMRAVSAITGNQQIQNRHAHGHTVCNLFENAGLWAVSDFRSDFDAAIHRTGMQDKCVRLGALQSFGIQLVTVNVIIRRYGGFVLAFRLHAQHDDDVGVFDGFCNFVNAANDCAWRDLFQFARYPHRRTAKGEAAAKFPQEVDIRTGDARVGKIPENRDIEILDGAFAVANGEGIQQSLRRMFMGAIAGIDHWNIQTAGDVIRRARCRMTHHQTVRLHGIQVEGGIEKCFAFLQTGGLSLEIHGVCAEPGRRGIKTDARARGSFKKSQRDGFSAQRRKFLQWMALNFLEWFALIEKKRKLGRGKRLESQKITESVSHNFLPQGLYLQTLKPGPPGLWKS